MDGLNPTEQNALEKRMTEKSMKLIMTAYNQMVSKCFGDCVNDFSSKSLQSREEGCVMRCYDKSLKSQERLTQRFQEINAAIMQSGQLPGR
ncbi:MAG: protein transporter tim9 [Cirrosporium novae-zelandiae]|nr:MAG: protein transporter tim9 [Cirrosporium novae-zelandiae]